MNHAEKALFQLINELVEGRVYALVAPQNSPTPYVIMQRIESERWRSINAPSGIAQAHIQVDVYASDFDTARVTAGAIEDVLDGYMGIVSCGSPPVNVPICGISLQNEHDILDQTDEPRLFRNIAEYIVTYKQ
jgi:hypothetical protein